MKDFALAGFRLREVKLRTRRISRLQLPRIAYDPPLLARAQDRIPHLSQDDKCERRKAALHEAAHCVVAVRLGVPVYRVIVKVAGRYPNGVSMRGIRGLVSTARYEHSMYDAMVDAAGPLFDVLQGRTTWNSDWEHDERNCEEALRCYMNEHPNTTDEDFRRILDSTVALLVEHWAAIDGAAAAILDLSRADGVLDGKKLQMVEDWIRSRAWHARDTLHKKPSIRMPFSSVFLRQ